MDNESEDRDICDGIYAKWGELGKGAEYEIDRMKQETDSRHNITHIETSSE